MIRLLGSTQINPSIRLKGVKPKQAPQLAALEKLGFFALQRFGFRSVGPDCLHFYTFARRFDSLLEVLWGIGLVWPNSNIASVARKRSRQRGSTPAACLKTNQNELTWFTSP